VTNNSGNAGAVERMMKYDEGHHVNYCRKTQDDVPHSGKKHANYKIFGSPHAERSLSPTTTSTEAMMTNCSANTGAAKKMMKLAARRMN
jgi:hypothetical protein